VSGRAVAATLSRPSPAVRRPDQQPAVHHRGEQLLDEERIALGRRQDDGPHHLIGRFAEQLLEHGVGLLLGQRLQPQRLLLLGRAQRRRV
jgi:hypothetical protein